MLFAGMFKFTSAALRETFLKSRSDQRMPNTAGSSENIAKTRTPAARVTNRSAMLLRRRSNKVGSVIRRCAIKRPLKHSLVAHVIKRWNATGQSTDEACGGEFRTLAKERYRSVE